MGFGTSKFKGSLVFAYLIKNIPSPNEEETTTTLIQGLQPDDDDDDDFLLQNPQGYGLSKSRHRDSGYYDERLQIDLNYIDSTYYPVKPITNVSVPPTPPKRNRFQQKIILEANYQISFSDLLMSAEDKSLRQLYLSYKSIERLSPNIGMLTMIRKLDL